MASPVETLADALIAFILSLLRDPDAAEEFAAAPQATLASKGLQDVCRADVDVVRPIIIDRPDVVQHGGPPPPPPHGHDHDPVQEIVRMVQHFSTTVDARSTVVDQSVNQNIWTEGGDVTQLFDQDAVVASGDDSIAAGDDVQVVDSETDISMGDVSIGNETNEGSFNQTGTLPDDAADEEATPDASEALDAAPGGVDAVAVAEGVADQSADAVGAGVETAAAAPAAAPPADVPEPADLLEGDMTSGAGDAYEADAASASVVDDPAAEVPLEDD
ncbi:hypothetical protein FVO59_09630 [Microbacterium esteraromaticum]|uniref:Uncharacterized protein n=1 Tax=Microbacterium esteraromaticum TaxID=57043 RepID=A0A7D8ALX9_9MICO|nr:IniB N-terminal domain-containing protein [Microbacterium esteraromaticum]QMU97448.1 hypothetical protein FVO59_09630 [Microbacterium esteraromaticum]